ncbi:hypothetical protein FGADI_2703 [Fusarium gaditjirri]|uniref:Zn(2)-C6 fungal-type domain-containing protein n=1 Tax=Fusarium gaditjirri TaxID=282569 RepID=A0A8H4THC3_9HYPO|nr:hypothetical protein FGADI_2703 [Fusarium gaditjirri]
MVGVPSSRGCNSCRKAKKRCDQQQPKCGRCIRLGHACIGSGTRRFKFHQYKPDTTQTTQLITPPSETPSNDTTRLTAEFISLMEIDDDRYGFEAYGPYFFTDLPRRIGSNSALDTTTSAMIASFQAIRLRKTADKKTFCLYGKALRSLQGCLSDDKQPVMLKLELVLMMMLCQIWIDNKHANKHRGVIAYLLKEAVSQGEILHSGDIRAWCLQAIYAALCDPNVELGSWFWDVAVQDTIMTRPYHYEQNLYCFELGAIGDLPVFLRDPERYLYQLKCYYNILSQERVVMRKLYEEAMVATLSTDALPACRMKAIEYASGHAGLLIQAALIGPTLNPFGVLPDYRRDSHEICDDAILLAHRCQTFRPCGASYVPELLKLVWASLGDGYRHEELEKLMDEYAEDVQGASYLEEAKIMRASLPQSSLGSVVSARVFLFCLSTCSPSNTAYLVLMADKPTTAPQTPTIPTMTTTEKSSSGFLKVIAFFDLVVKLAATGALIGILVLLVQFNSNINKLFNGSRSLPVRVSDAAPLRIMPGYSGTFDVRMTNNANDPVWFKVDN